MKVASPWARMRPAGSPLSCSTSSARLPLTIRLSCHSAPVSVFENTTLGTSSSRVHNTAVVFGHTADIASYVRRPIICAGLPQRRDLSRDDLIVLGRLPVLVALRAVDEAVEGDAHVQYHGPHGRSLRRAIPSVVEVED